MGTPRRTAATPYRLAIAVALVTGGLAVLAAEWLGLPLRDPEGFLGPSYVRLPALVGIFLLLDVLPRAVLRARRTGRVWPAAQGILRERWPVRRLIFVLTGLACFYLTYVGYRNLKSFLPFVRTTRDDDALLALDQALAFGVEPAQVLHAVMGTGLTAHVLSVVYVSYLIFVPMTLAYALVWTRDIAVGAWYTTALCLNWALGTLSYYLVPSMGPIFVRRSVFEDLPDTGVTALQNSLFRAKWFVLPDPWGVPSVHGIAAFASLHVSVTFTVALMAQLVRLNRVVRWSLWVYFGLTAVATIYFGWHYLLDDVAGVAIGATAVALGALATRSARARSAPPTVPPAVPAPAGATPAVAA